MVGGFLHQRPMRTRDRQEAQRREAAWRLEMTSGEFGLTSGDAPMLAGFEKRFFDHLETKVKPRTLNYYKTFWKTITRDQIASTRISRITSTDIEAFIQRRRKKTIGKTENTLKIATVNHSLRVLRRALHLAHEWNLIRKVPKITLLTGEHQRDFVIDEALLKRMLEHEKCTPALKVLVPFLIDTGLRLGEALALQWSSVDIEKKKIRVTGGKSKAARRVVPLTKRAVGLLTDIKGTSKGKKVFDVGGQFWLEHQFRKLRQAMGLPGDCVLHSCRHTFCTRLGNSGASAFKIRTLAGHSSVTISQRYVHEDQEDLGDAIATMEEKSEKAAVAAK